MTRWIPFETLARLARRRALPAIVATLAVAGITFVAPALAHAIGPRADATPQAPAAPRATPAPIVLPEFPDLPETEFYRALELFRPLAPQGWFGIGLQCSDCTISRDDSSGARVWSFEEPPEIHYVDPDGPAGKAGLRRGDKLTHVDGASITNPEGGRRFGAVKPGESVRWTYERDGKTFIATLVAEEHPDRAFLIDPDVSEELQRSLADLRAEQARMLEESRNLRTDRRATRSYENALRIAQEAQRSLERTQESLRRRGYVVVPHAPEAPEPPEPPEPRKLRYEGTVGDSEVEVHGTGSIVVRRDERGAEELVITTPDATIRIRKKK